MLTVSRNNEPRSGYASLADALRAAQPGNIIEIADSGTYPGGLVISTNEEGLPLHGITIRAGAGQKPILDAAAGDATSGVRVVGLQDVLLQGLEIAGGGRAFCCQGRLRKPLLRLTIDHLQGFGGIESGIGGDRGSIRRHDPSHQVDHFQFCGYRHPGLGWYSSDGSGFHPGG